MKKCFGKIGVLCITMLLAASAVVFTLDKTKSQASETKSYKVNLYKGNLQATGFTISTATIKNLTAYSLIKELKAIGSVAKNVKANSLEYVGKNLTLDLSKEFAEDVSNSGTSGEYIKVGCVVNTFIDAFKVDTLTITVDGKAWQSSHCIYDSPLEKYAYNVTLYMSNANADAFETMNVQIYNLTAYSIINELKNVGVISKNVKANSLNYVNGKLTLDLSKEFQQDVYNQGTSGEYMLIGSIVNTFIDAFEVDTLTITVDGNVLDSGHAVYDQPLSKFE